MTHSPDPSFSKDDENQTAASEGDLFVFPTSFAQQRLWFLDLLEPGSIAYNITAAFRLFGPINVTALELSLNEILRRHEVLRTTFTTADDQPVQVISSSLTLTVQVVDLQDLLATERDSEVQRLATEEAQRPFDLSKGPLLRATLLKLNEEDHVLLLTIHHIIFDGWSMGVLFRELSILYEAFSAGKPSPLAELAIQYADFAVWQRQWLQGDVLETQLAYWRQQLDGAAPALELPTDRPRPAVQTHRGAIESLALSKELTDALQAISRREGVTLFMTLLAAFKTLLYRLTGQKDIIVGTPIAGRNRTELEGLIGFFVNTLVMRTDLSGQPSFRELLGRVRETALGAYAHQDMPFERLVEELNPERDMSHTPLFQVMFNMTNVRDIAFELHNLSAERVSSVEPESKFDFTLYATEIASGIELRLFYNTDLFDSWRMAEMLKQYAILLAKIVENPEERISRYSLITPSQVKLLPDPTRPIGLQWEGAVHTIFTERARLASERLAVMDTAESWNYRDLDRRSNQLANYLVTLEVQQGDVVAIYAHRSASLVWALLGVLKAGAAFLILDPAYPSRRLIDILEAAKPKAWFQIEAAGELSEELTENVEAQMANCHLVLPGLASAVELGLLEDYSDKDPEIVVGPDDLAYVAFTSGTTGEPKGIVGTHGPLSHFLNWHIEKFSFNASDRFSMLSGLSHDPLLRDIFAPLWAGATLYIPEPGKILFPAKLISWMNARQITVAHMTPALSEVFAEGTQEAESIKEILPSIRYIFFGGDVLTWRHVEKIKQIAPSAEFVNYYGATETPQAMGYHVVDARKNGQFADGIPLGKGIEGVQLLVLNAAGRLAGVGEIAEVHVRTPYLSKGYLNDETLTVAKFIGNPYTNTEDDRIYKTGDLGRYLPDGQVMFHGRSDRQVSLRGFRIELGEVEATLCLNPSVSEAVVVAREDRPGDKRLVAYVVAAAAESAPSTGVLRAFLQEKLPDYMIPSAFVFLDALPLTANRKVDRRALPAPDGTRPELKETFVMPRTPVEEILAGIWSDLLGVIQVGIYDNFFDLGGHSLMATRLISRLREVFQLELPLRSLFEAPTVIGLTELILRDPEKREKVEKNAKLLLRVAQLSENDVENILTEKF